MSEIRQELLDILVCPESKAPLVHQGERLISTDPETRRAYRIDDGIPVMLIDESEVLSPEQWREAMSAAGKDPDNLANS